MDLLFPPKCVGCGKLGAFLCSACSKQLDYLPRPLCVKCSEPLRSGTICPKCLEQEWDIDGIIAVFRYDDAIRRAIIQFKYENVKALSVPLSSLMAEYLKKHPMPADVIVPVPAHKRRLRERGYNQSALLSHKIGRSISMPVSEMALIRTRNTSPQAKTESMDQRRTNMTGAFACRKKSVAGKHILLIDDVCTTGNTLNACAAPLKAAGAASVWALTLAKEI